MIRSSALFVAIVISLLIGILCASLVLVSYATRLQIQKDNLINRLQLNVNSGVNLLLSESGYISFGEEKVIDLFGEERDSLFLSRKHWGLFDVGIAKAFFRNHYDLKVFEYGYKPDSIQDAALYLADQNRPLSVAGETLLKGVCYLPKAGIIKGYIEGQSFSGTSPVDGKIKNSDPSLPDENPKVIERIKKLLQDTLSVSKSEFIVENSIKKDSVINSFLDTTLLIYSLSPVVLENVYCKGNVIVYSQKSVLIKSSAQLDNIQIYSPYIRVENNFKGRFQGFASDSISTGTGCSFTYPSALGLLKKKNHGKRLYIQLGPDNKFKGILFTYNELSDKELTMISVGENTIVEGQIYSTGFVELLKNTLVKGNITCNRFLLRLNTTFDNYLFHTTIDRSQLSPHYVGSELLQSNVKREIISWLE